MVKQSPGIITPGSELPTPNQLLRDAESEGHTGMLDPRRLVKVPAYPVSRELIIHRKLVPLGKTPAMALSGLGRAVRGMWVTDWISRPMSLYSLPGPHTRIPTSNASSVASTSSLPCLSTSGRRKVADVSPWYPSRKSVRSTLTISSGCSGRLGVGQCTAHFPLSTPGSLVWYTVWLYQRLSDGWSLGQD